jgi:hypothetical protein
VGAVGAVGAVVAVVPFLSEGRSNNEEGRGGGVKYI